MKFLGDILRRNAQVLAGKPAVVQGSTRLSYSLVNKRANSLAHGLLEMGIKKGDRVALLSRNDYRFLEIYFGLPKIGAIFVPLSFWATADDLALIIKQCQASVLVVSPDFLDTAEAIRPRLPALRHLILLGDHAPAGMVPYEHLARDFPVDEPEADLEPDDDILILYTSGSTGKPKGAVYAHHALLYTAMVMSIELGLRETDVTLHFLPLFSSNLEHLLPLSLVGATHVILDKFDPSAAWQTVEREQVTYFDAVPTIMRLLQCPMLSQCDTSSLRLVCYASEPMPPATITAWLAALPHVEAVQFYGMIEFLCITVLKPWEQLSRLGTVGKPMLGTDLRLVNEEGQDVAVGTVGEVVARSACPMRGYWQSPDSTSKAGQDGWMRTGDLGRLDEDGYLTLVGRKKEIIKSGGMTVAPAEVEEVLYRHPAVAEAVVVGRADATWGEAVHAVVALKPEAKATAEELIRFCANHLAGYKKPRSVEFLPSLPKTGIGKIARKLLQDRIWTTGDASQEVT
ncbi:MAG: class I adenylate-forming enzyme family protein [Dehalococcoidia bacterium]